MDAQGRITITHPVVDRVDFKNNQSYYLYLNRERRILFVSETYTERKEFYLVDKIRGDGKEAAEKVAED